MQPPVQIADIGGALMAAFGILPALRERDRSGEGQFVTLGALEPKFFAALCRGADREDLVGGQFDAPGSETHAQLRVPLVSRPAEPHRGGRRG